MVLGGAVVEASRRVPIAVESAHGGWWVGTEDCKSTKEKFPPKMWLAEERQPLTVMTLDLYTLNIPIIIVIILFYMEIFNISKLYKKKIHLF